MGNGRTPGYQAYVAALALPATRLWLRRPGRAAQPSGAAGVAPPGISPCFRPHGRPSCYQPIKGDEWDALPDAAEALSRDTRELDQQQETSLTGIIRVLVAAKPMLAAMAPMTMTLVMTLAAAPLAISVTAVVGMTAA